MNRVRTLVVLFALFYFGECTFYKHLKESNIMTRRGKFRQHSNNQNRQIDNMDKSKILINHNHKSIQRKHNTIRKSNNLVEFQNTRQRRSFMGFFPSTSSNQTVVVACRENDIFCIQTLSQFTAKP